MRGTQDSLLAPDDRLSRTLYKGGCKAGGGAPYPLPAGRTTRAHTKFWRLDPRGAFLVWRGLFLLVLQSSFGGFLRLPLQAFVTNKA